MEFIKKMKKREFIELGLKTLTALLLAFMAIILMEGMIYSIKLNGYKTNVYPSVISQEASAVYCIKEPNKNTYIVLYHFENSEDPWRTTGSKLSKESIKELLEGNVKEIIWHAPSAFKLPITPIHYVIMAIFVGGVSGHFVYRFIKLSNSYKEIENNYKKTGTIEITNL